MKIGSIAIKLIATVYFLNLLAAPTAAQTVPIRPSFPSCLNPQGSLKVHYSTGTHGVPGNSNSYSGRDTVFTLSETTLTQCLCAEDDSGVQTNWWKISSLSFEEVEYLQKLGWVYVPDGTAWGLQQGPYMAQSSLYNCGSDDDDDGDDDDNDDNDDDDKDSSSQRKIGGGQVLGATTYLGDVLGLASTGNIVELVGLASLAIGSLGVITYYGTKKK